MSHFVAVLLAMALLTGAAPPRRITVDLKDASLHNVLRLLADVGKVNIVVPDEVQGKVTLRVKDVPWTEALSVVLSSKGLGMERKGSVIQVDTLERILRRTEVEAALRDARQSSGELITVMFPLSYAKAADLKPLVQSLLSPRGRVEIDVRTNTLIVTDIAANAEAVRTALGR